LKLHRKKMLDMKNLSTKLVASSPLDFRAPRQILKHAYLAVSTIRQRIRSPMLEETFQGGVKCQCNE